MITAIPLTEFSRITQTKSSPETIAALLNEAERMYSTLQKPLHFNTKYVFPFWKICQHCSALFPCLTREQVTRNKFCSPTCQYTALSISKKGHWAGGRHTGLKPLSERKLGTRKCPVCGVEFSRPLAWLKKSANPVCSKKCNGFYRGQEWGQHAHKAAAALTKDGKRRKREAMLGVKNPAWKGGVTYFTKHGNYSGVKYVRCPDAYRPMARKDGYVMEHRLLVAQAIGRCLQRAEVVHHIDHDPTNNALANLQLFASNQAHKLYEHRGLPAPIWPQ